jgi:hypothetical protein
MIVRVRDREQPLAAKFNDVLELGRRHIYMAKGLAYLQENRQYIVLVNNYDNHDPRMHSEEYLGKKGSS